MKKIEQRFLAVAMMAILVPTVAFAQSEPSRGKQTQGQETQSKRGWSETGSTSEQDLQEIAKVRRSIVNDDSLSPLAHNVKIMSQREKIVLRGPVRSEDEKRMVESRAVEAVGQGRVQNELEVKKESSAGSGRQQHQ